MISLGVHDQRDVRPLCEEDPEHAAGSRQQFEAGNR